MRLLPSASSIHIQLFITANLVAKKKKLNENVIRYNNFNGHQKPRFAKRNKVSAV